MVLGAQARSLARAGQTYRVLDWYVTAPPGEDIRFLGETLNSPCPCKLWIFEHVASGSRIKIDAETGQDVGGRYMVGADQGRAQAALDAFAQSVRSAK